MVLHMRYMLTCLGVALTPVFVGVLLLQAVQHTTLDHLTPCSDDEIYYWHQAQTFAQADFNGGYYTVSEVIPKLGYAHYFVWSPFLPMLYGTVGHVLGGQLNSITLFNALFFFIGILGALAVLHLSYGQLGAFAVILASFPPLILLFPSSMPELLHYSIAVITGAIFAQHLKGSTPRKAYGFSAFLVGVMLLRPTWGLLILPALWLGHSPKTWREVAWVFAQWLIIFLPVALFFQWSSAPYPHFRSQFFASGSLIDALTGMVNYFFTSVGRLFHGGAPSVLLQRAQVAVLLIGLTVFAVMKWRNVAWFTRYAWAEMALHGYNLVGVYVATLALHEVVDGRDYRMIAPHVLLSLVLLVARGRYGWLGAFALSAMMSVSPIMAEYQKVVTPCTDGHVSQQYEQWKPILAPHMQYDSQKNAWCNTLSYSFIYGIDFTGYAGLLLAVDEGIGLSWINPQQPPDTLKAGYVMLTNYDYAVGSEKVSLTKLVDVKNGALYRNENAECD